MRTGTKSVLFGVHAFYWHPITVAIAWRRYHGQWPKHLSEWVAILCHDLGYWGKPNMDGEEGKDHPWGGAKIAGKIMVWLGASPDRVAAAILHVLGHSKSFAKARGFLLSPLYAPDKLCAVYDPAWFYILRATLSGELNEFRENGPEEYKHDSWEWYRWYQNKVKGEFYAGSKHRQSQGR